jgi:hypothetical protein
MYIYIYKGYLDADAVRRGMVYMCIYVYMSIYEYMCVYMYI